MLEKSAKIHKNELYQIRNEIVNWVLIACTTLGIIAQIFATLRIIYIGFKPVIIYQNLILASCIIVTVFRNRIHLHIKTAFILSIIFLVMISGFKYFGFLASSKVYLIVIPLFSTFILGFRKTLAIVIFSLVLFLLIGYLYTKDILSYDFNVERYIDSTNTWIMDGSILILTAAGVLIISNRYCTALISKINTFENKNKRISDNEKKYTLLFENSNDAIILIRDNTIIDCNRKSLELFAVKKPDFSGRTLYEFNPQNYAEESVSMPGLSDYFKMALTAGPQRFEWQFRTAAGDTFYAEVSLSLVELDKVQFIQAIIRDITERKETSQELISSEARFRSLTTNIPGAIYRCKTDIPWHMNYVTDNVLEITGYSASQFLDKKITMSDIIDREDLIDINITLTDAIIERNTYKLEYKIRHANGKTRWLMERGKAVYNELGKPLWLDGIIFDITEWKESEQALQESERNYRQIFNSTSEAIIIHDAKNGKVLDVNDRMLDMYNCKRKDIINHSIRDISANTGTYIFKNAIRKFNQAVEEGTQVFEWLAKKQTGEHFWVEVSLQPTKIGRENRVLAVIRDITERKNIVKALRESEERFRLLIVNIPVVTHIVSQEGRTTYISPNIEKVFGFSPDEIYEKGMKLWLDRIHPDDLKMVKIAFQKLFSEENRYDIEYRIRRKDRTWIWVHDRANISHKFDGMLYAYGVISDITRQKNAELKVKENEIQYRTLYENASDAILLLKDNVFIDCNPRSIDLFSCTSENLIGKKPWEISPVMQPDGNNSKESITNWVDLAISGTPQHFEWVFNKNKNESFIADVSLNSIELKNEKFLLALLRDITERKQKHKEILRAVIKAEEKERSRIARDLHDGISPILSTIKLLSQSLSQCEDKELQKKMVIRIEVAVREAITSLSEISIKLSPHILQNFGIVEAIRNFIKEINVVRLLKVNFKTNIKERMNENIEITLYRIVIELINNTVKHARADTVDIILLKNENVSLFYRDNGRGFDVDEALKKKKGMGLHNLKTRIESVNGTYNLFSAPGKGVRLELSIS